MINSWRNILLPKILTQLVFFHHLIVVTKKILYDVKNDLPLPQINGNKKTQHKNAGQRGRHNRYDQKHDNFEYVNKSIGKRNMTGCLDTYQYSVSSRDIHIEANRLFTPKIQSNIRSQITDKATHCVILLLPYAPSEFRSGGS